MTSVLADLNLESDLLYILIVILVIVAIVYFVRRL